MRRRALLLALALDLLGEPPARWHPVVWMGQFLKASRRQWRGEAPGAQLREGLLGWAAGTLLSAAAGTLAARLPWPAQGALLKPLLARRALLRAGSEVAGALEAGDLPGARRLLSWHLVSRDTADLTASEVAGAAIASVAENLSDSVVGPLLAARVGGLPLAAAYRFTNTADAMWGYRTPELEWAGKGAAHADDLLNLAPARLSAACLLLAAGGRGLGVWRRDHGRTPSPNGGHPMSAAAGALGVRLEKRGLYVLNAGGQAPGAADLRRALHLTRRASALATLVLMLPCALPRPARRARGACDRPGWTPAPGAARAARWARPPPLRRPGLQREHQSVRPEPGADPGGPRRRA
ncbi:adenosylcobinamide-phosphate synthase CbiB (plasmid) [Deinococcus taeanensis]|uniref:adenosylcobinamide-phosphate synthase CbiB n=1 Tax=Deinococcus taeanensis TaxID=2737050 RepID=UPI001CDD7E60|nr:adenosylcobinamide-phosphate synthase CbiB [Deinococcus taeanensis]UBV44874.1 adenosylcobinamide-phosphate synthase CbiB [Deinococcus taeanensis]